jgi:ABC-type uncharacterized transport system permease subunit
MRIANLIFSLSLFLYGVGLVLYCIYLTKTKESFNRWWTGALLLGFLIHTILAVFEILSLIQDAQIHLFEVLVFLSWALVGLTLILQTRIRLRILLGMILALVLGIGGFALLLPKYFSKTIPDVNALWFGTHIMLALLGYAAFAVACLSSLLYLLLDRQLKWKKEYTLLNRLPPLESLEWINFRSLWAGTVFLGLGLLSGWIWQSQSGWGLSLTDPKVLAAWGTFFIYAGVIGVRSTARWSGRKTAYLSVLGFVSVLVTFFVMNYFSKGHGFF